MLLTQEQHRRGFVRWVGGTEVSVVIGTPDGSVKSTPMVDSTGSVPDFVPPRDGEFEVIPTNADVVDSPFRIVWDHLTGSSTSDPFGPEPNAPNAHSDHRGSTSRV
jgi:hypothetical protein